MATVQQIDANRRNAQLSTGPATPEGKQRAAANSLQSGIYAESEIIFTESREALEALKIEYYDRFQPATPETRDLVDSLIRSAWLLRRFAAAEASLLNLNQPEDLPEDPNERMAARMSQSVKRLDLLQRRINSTERNYHRSLKVLQSIEPPPELGSFPQNLPLREDSAPPHLGVESTPGPPPQSEPTSEKLASFPQNSFPREHPAPTCPGVESTPDARLNPQPSYPKSLEQPPL